MKKFLIGLCLWLALAGGTALFGQGACPAAIPVPPDTTCYAGMDENRAFYLIAMPANYNNQLVLWNHGYDLAPPQPLTRRDDLGYPVLLLQEGFAVAASSYRPGPTGLGGWAVADAIVDTENLRQRFVQQFGAPDLTFVVGASEGGIITAGIAEVFGTDPDGNLVYNGSLPMCGPLAGGRRNWYGGFDLRVVYQYFCRNLPRPSEPQYDLYLGLRPGDTLTDRDVAARIDECTGVLRPPEQRTAEQRRNLANILNVSKIPESFLITDMAFATFALQELVLLRTGGKSPVTNLGVTYTGSTDDVALNRDVYRHGSDPDAVDYLSAAYDPTGIVAMPTATMHTIGDGLVIVENENAYQEVFMGDALFQTYTNAGGHCQFSFSEFEAVFHALLGWVTDGTEPTQDQVVALCDQYRSVLGDTCNFNTTFRPNSFGSRVADREP